MVAMSEATDLIMALLNRSQSFCLKTYTKSVALNSVTTYAIWQQVLSDASLSGAVTRLLCCSQCLRRPGPCPAPVEESTPQAARYAPI